MNLFLAPIYLAACLWLIGAPFTRLNGRIAVTKQIQTPRYIVQNSMNLKQYRHRPSHDSSQCFNLFPASAEKIRKTYRLRKRVFGKIPRENNIQFIQTILSRSKCFILNLILTEKSPSENSNNF